MIGPDPQRTQRWSVENLDEISRKWSRIGWVRQVGVFRNPWNSAPGKGSFVEYWLAWTGPNSRQLEEVLPHNCHCHILIMLWQWPRLLLSIIDLENYRNHRVSTPAKHFLMHTDLVQPEEASCNQWWPYNLVLADLTHLCIPRWPSWTSRSLPLR
jgi:hypothetical protein